MKYLERFNIHGFVGFNRKKSNELNTLYDIQDILQDLDDRFGYHMIFDLKYEYPQYSIQITKEQYDYFKINPLVEYIQRILYYINLNNFVITSYTIDLNPKKTLQLLYKDEYLDHQEKGGNWITFMAAGGRLKPVDGTLLIDSDFVHEVVPTTLCRIISIVFRPDDK